MGVKVPTRKPKGEELSITSMMDMMTIILVFLLKSYSTQDISVAGDKDLVLPNSSSVKDPETLVNLVVSRSMITVDGTPLVPLEELQDPDNPEIRYYGVPEQDASGEQLKEGFLITPLFETLDRKAQEQKELAERTQNEKFAFKGRILLQCDKELPFSTIREVMYTAGQAQFGEFKFVVYKSSG